MRKILVIDDDAMARRMAEFSLKKLGLSVVSAASGAEGLEKLRCEAPDLTLLDVEMPGESGLEVLKKLRAADGIGAAKVWLMSGTLTAELQAEGEKLEVSGFLQKPIAPPSLKAMLEESGLLGGEGA